MDVATQPNDIIEPQDDAQLANAAPSPDPSNDQIDPTDFYREGDEPVSDDQEAAPGEEEQTEDKPEPVEAPLSWSKDAKEVFGQLPREAQEIILTREKERETFLQTKSREAATTRQAVETEARGVIQQMMQAHAQSLESYAGMLSASPPDIRLLQSGDPQHHALYNEQDRQYRIASAQHAEIMQQVEQSRQQASIAQQQIDQALIEREHETLNDRLGTEWSDPSARAKLLTDLEPIAAELGYSADQMVQARASDILALRTARSWKADAEKYRQLMKRKMEPVRAAKQIPPAARAGSPVARQGQPVDAAAMLYPNDVRRN